MTAKQIYAQLKERLSPDGKTYLFLDEVQEIKNWEKIVNSLASDFDIVYLELCRRGYTVNIGKTSDGEIDFVAVRQNEKIHVQVTQKIRSEKTEKREYDRLLEIHDNYPKYVLTTDEFAGGNYEGIKTMHIADFLLSSEY